MSQMAVTGCPRDIGTKELSKTERVATYVPSYGGYKEKELRREMDRLIREKASRRLQSAAVTVERALSKAVDEIGPDKSKVINKLIFRLNYIYNEVAKAPTGYVGLFDAVKVKEEELDALIDHDFAMIELAGQIENKGKELLELTMRGDYDSISRVIEELQTILSKIEGTVDSREAILREI